MVARHNVRRERPCHRTDLHGQSGHDRDLRQRRQACRRASPRGSGSGGGEIPANSAGTEGGDSGKLVLRIDLRFQHRSRCHNQVPKWEKAIAAGDDLTQTIDRDSEVYTVRDRVWEQAGMGEMDGCLLRGHYAGKAHWPRPATEGGPARPSDERQQRAGDAAPVRGEERGGSILHDRLRAAGPPPSFDHLHDPDLLQRLTSQGSPSNESSRLPTARMRSRSNRRTPICLRTLNRTRRCGSMLSPSSHSPMAASRCIAAP